MYSRPSFRAIVSTNLFKATLILSCISIISVANETLACQNVQEFSQEILRNKSSYTLLYKFRLYLYPRRIIFASTRLSVLPLGIVVTLVFLLARYCPLAWRSTEFNSFSTSIAARSNNNLLIAHAVL
jgi:hypothetical protein